MKIGDCGGYAGGFHHIGNSVYPIVKTLSFLLNLRKVNTKVLRTIIISSISELQQWERIKYFNLYSMFKERKR